MNKSEVRKQRIKESAVQVKMKVEALEGYMKIFLNAYRLKEESNDIEYLIN